MKTFKEVWLISDELPGHVNQAKGLVAMLEESTDIGVIKIVKGSLRYKWLRLFLRYFLNRSNQKISQLLVTFAYLPIDIVSSPSLIISAGGNTSFLNVFLAKKHHCPNIFIGSPRHLSPNLFSALLTLEKVEGAVSNIVMDIAPTLVDPEKTKKIGDKFKEKKQLDNKLWGMILGGDGAGFYYTLEDWQLLAAAMTELAERNEIKWLLTSSRRTGGVAERDLKMLIPEEVLAYVVWYNHTPEKVLSAFLGASERVFCTADSMSMIADSISSGITTTVIKPIKCKPNKKYGNVLKNYQSKNLIDLVNISDLDTWRVSEARDTSIFIHRSRQKIISSLCDHL